MDKIEYPKFKYHATEPAVIVQNKEEDLALGKGWFENPVEQAQTDHAPDQNNHQPKAKNGKSHGVQA